MRSEQRSFHSDDFVPGGAPENPAWIQAARASRAEGVRKAGLEQELSIASQYLGESSATQPRTSPAVPEPTAPGNAFAPWGVRLCFWAVLAWTFRR